MRDLHRWACLFVLLASAACGSKQTKPPEDDFAADTVEPPQQVAWPERQRACGDTGDWCGPLSQVQGLAPAGDEDDDSEEGEEAACPEQFSREPFTFTLDAEATQNTMSSNCCYDYRDDTCRQP